jgi:hypothetical protein
VERCERAPLHSLILVPVRFQRRKAEGDGGWRYSWLLRLVSGAYVVLRAGRRRLGLITNQLLCL